jgi:hypothetical protein
VLESSPLACDHACPSQVASSLLDKNEQTVARLDEEATAAVALQDTLSGWLDKSRGVSSPGDGSSDVLPPLTLHLPTSPCSLSTAWARGPLLITAADKEVKGTCDRLKLAAEGYSEGTATAGAGTSGMFTAQIEVR